MMMVGERRCGAARDLGGQGPCPLKSPCADGHCAIESGPAHQRAAETFDGSRHGGRWFSRCTCGRWFEGADQTTAQERLDDHSFAMATP